MSRLVVSLKEHEPLRIGDFVVRVRRKGRSSNAYSLVVDAPRERIVRVLREDELHGGTLQAIDADVLAGARGE